MLSDTARLLARAMPTGKTVTIPASSLSENGSSYEPTEEEKLYRELLDDVKNRPPHLRIGLESVLPAKDQSPEDWARDMTQQIMARRAANEDKRNLWERFVDTSNFAASLPVRVATKGEYGLGDVLNDQGVSDAEARFAKANQVPLEAVSNLGELAGALPTWEGIGAIPKGILSNALRKAPKMPTASELSRTTFSGGIPETKVVDDATKWFEGSKVVDDSGAPIYVYRGGKAGADDASHSRFFSPNEDYALRYAEEHGPEGVMTKSLVNLRNPLIAKEGDTLDWWYNHPEAKGSSRQAKLKSLQDAGYDGIITTKPYGHQDGEVIAFDPGSVRDVARARVTDAGLSAYEDIANALPMDESSRMARAQEMGFDTSQKWYHGTAGDHTSFSPSYSGSVSSGDGRGIWFTTNPRYAGEYAENAAGIRGEDPRIIEAYLAPKKPLTVEFDEYGKPMVGGKRVDFESNSDVLNYAMKNGYDSIHWPDGSFTDEPAMTIFKPNQIRDIDATFDPKKANLSDIMASVAGMFGIPALAASTSRRD